MIDVVLRVTDAGERDYVDVPAHRVVLAAARCGCPCGGVSSLHCLETRVRCFKNRRTVLQACWRTNAMRRR